jgi:redox-sensing transcriptional repressor
MIKGKDSGKIPKVVIERLPRYYRYFDWLDGQVEKISSKKLGELMDTSASQVRLDLSYFGDFGQQGYGYNVKKLKHELANILDINTKKNVIIIGHGIKGILNFSRTDLEVPKEFPIENIHIIDKILALSFIIKSKW